MVERKKEGRREREKEREKREGERDMGFERKMVYFNSFFFNIIYSFFNFHLGSPQLHKIKFMFSTR